MSVTAVIKMPMDGALGETGTEDPLHYAGYTREQFSAALSTASGPDTKVVDWRWSCTCGWTDQGRHVQHRPDTVATHTVTLTVLGDAGGTDTETKDVVAVDLPSVPLVMDTYHKGAGSDSDTGVDDAHAYSAWERSGYRWREGDITHARYTPGRVRTKAGDGIDWTSNNDDVTSPRHYDDFDFGPLVFDAYGSGARPDVHFGAGKRIAFLATHHVPDEWGWSVYFKGLRCFKDAQEDDGVGSNIPGSQYDDCVFENFGVALQGNFKRAFVGGRVTGSATTGLHVACNWVAIDGVTIDSNGLDGVDAEHQVYGTDINHGCFRRLPVIGSSEANDCLRSVSSRYVYVADCDVSNTRNAGAAYYPGSNGTTFAQSEHWLGERLIARDGGDTACAIDFNHNDDSLLRNFKFFGDRMGIVLRGYDATHKANDTRLYHGISYDPGSGVRNFTVDGNATLSKIRNVIFFRDDNEPFFSVEDPADVDIDYCCFWRTGGTNDADDANFAIVAGVTRSLSWWRANSANDDHSFFRNPEWTDAPARDFTLLASSPCIGTGQTLGEVPRDWDDAVRSGAATIGPYHYDPTDSTPPTVALTAPAEGATVTGTVAVTATASDDVGVVGVQFKLDGVNLGAEDTSAPYSISWDSTGTTDGAHSLTAVARDAAGNTTTSAVVHVTVDNTAPTVSITSPAEGAALRGTVAVAASAADSIGVVGVQFKLDGVNLGAEDTSAPYSVSWDTTGASDGAHTLTAVARDAAGNTTTSAAVHVTVDNTAPAVSITTPTGGSALKGTVPVSASASDNIGVVGVQFKLDGVNLGSELTAGPFTISWDTTTASNGSHSLTAVARDAAGNTTTSSAVAVTVDNAAPTVSITSPSEGAKLRGTVVVTATAADNAGVVGVQFKVDGVNLGSEDTSAPYSVSLDTTLGTNGAHTLTAVARDAAGNTTTSAPVHVIVDNAAPAVAVTAPAEGATVVGSVLVTATASDNVGVVGVQLKLDGANLGAELTVAPFTATWDSTSAVDGAHTLAAVARDAAGNTTTSATVHVTVDNTAPAVEISEPADLDTVSGTIDVTADASDAIGVVGVQLKLDGANFGAELTTAPYTLSWDTTIASDGAHVLTAVARDAAGHSTTSAPVHVQVENEPPPPPDTDPPTIAITAPAEDETVSGTVSIEVDVSDNVGVVGVQFKLDGLELDAEVLAPPFDLPWDTTDVEDGTHVLTAVARDAAGNATISAPVSVEVDNAPPPDTDPPVVTIVSPQDGATVHGTIGIAVYSSDNVGVVGVTFKLDGVDLSSELNVPPFTFLWDTTSSEDGAHVLTAVARDLAGNVTTSAAIDVVIDNAAPPPPPPPAPPPGGVHAAVVQSRKAIRQAVRRLLLGQTSAGSRVFTNRSEAVQHERNGGELPALLVLTPTEPVEMASQAPPVYRRRLRIAIALIVHRNDGFEVGLNEVGVPLGETETEELDRLCHDVEQLLLCDPTLELTTGLRLADDCIYVDTQFDFDDRAEQVIGSARVQFDYVYQTEILERGVALAVDLRSVHVDHKTKPPGDRIVAADDIDVPTE